MRWGSARNVIGVLQGMLTLALAVGALCGGRLGDRFGRWRVVMVTLLVFLVGVGLLTAAVSVTTLAVGVVLVGLGIGADLPVSLSLIIEEAPEGRRAG